MQYGTEPYSQSPLCLKYNIQYGTAPYPQSVHYVLHINPNITQQSQHPLLTKLPLCPNSLHHSKRFLSTVVPQE